MCETCKQNPCNCKCPNYESPKTDYYCSICGEGIYNGDEYIENDDGKFRHYDCFSDTSELLKWLGHEVKTMNEDYE